MGAVKTFVVRLWPASEEDTRDAPLRGTIEGPGSARSSAFRSDRELLALLHEGLRGPTDVSIAQPTEGGGQ